MAKLFGGSIHTALIHAATEYDRKLEAQAAKRRAYFNHYAMSHYLNRITEVEADIASGKPVRQALLDGFNGRLLDHLLKAVGGN